MSATGLDAFDTSVQTTNIWLRDLMAELGWEDHHKAYHAMRVVLHALRDRLPVDEAVQLAAQLPMLVRGFTSQAEAGTLAARAVDSTARLWSGDLARCVLVCPEGGGNTGLICGKNDGRTMKRRAEP